MNPVQIPPNNFQVRPHVHLVEYPENQGSLLNPDPIITDDNQLMMIQYLSPRRLRDLTGKDDLEEIISFEAKVDSREGSLGNFGTHLPNLQYLHLNDSHVEQIRDLGSSLSNVKVLWMSRSWLWDVDGVSTMINVTEMYLAYNEISELGPFSMLENLNLLDLEGNNVDCLYQVEHLGICPNLETLTLDNNPVCKEPAPNEKSDDYDYRAKVIQCITQLKVLDGKNIKEYPSSSNVPTNVFEADWEFINQLKEEGLTSEESESNLTDNSRPSSSLPSSGRLNTSYRPGSALKPSTPQNRPKTTSRPSTASRFDLEEAADDYHSSLTKGALVYGNLSCALRRRNKALQESKKKPLSPSISTEKSTPSPDLADEMNEISKDVENWKMEHRKRMQLIEEANAPQILKIEDGGFDDDEDALSSDNNEDELQEEPKPPKTPPINNSMPPIQSRRKFRLRPIQTSTALDSSKSVFISPTSPETGTLSRLRQNSNIPSLPSKPIVKRPPSFNQH